MGEKSEYGRLESGAFGIVYEAFQYLLMTNVHTVESADGNCGIF